MAVYVGVEGSAQAIGQIDEKGQVSLHGVAPGPISIVMYELIDLQ